MSARTISKVDIAVCTWNRPALLAQALAAFSLLRIPAQIQLRILIVDNNSSATTAAVIAGFEHTTDHPVVALFEPRQGHTFCRNLAVESADGDLLIWTDDDVMVAPDWVEKYVHAADANPEFAFWGSVIEPKFDGGKPPWIEKNWETLKGCFAHRDLGDSTVEFQRSRLPYGANFAIRTEVQKQFMFDSELGRRGEVVLGEDELDLFRRLLAAGHRGQWVPGAVAEHVIPLERATEDYVYEYFVGQGRALVAKDEPWHKDRAKLKREARSEYFKYKIKRPFVDTTVWVSHLIRCALAEGQYEALRG